MLSSASGLSVNSDYVSIQHPNFNLYEIACATPVLGHLAVSLIIPHREQMENAKF